MQAITKHGYAAKSLDLGEARADLRRTASEAVKQTSKQKYLSERRGFPIHPRALTASQWRRLFPDDRLEVIRQYLGGDPELLRIEVIDVPAGANRQFIHRDHDIGARKSLCVAVNLDGGDVGTLFLRDSHLTTTAATEDDQVVASQGNWIMYDTYTIHAGAANPTPHRVSERVFFTFRAPQLTRQERAHLTRRLAPRETSLHPPIPMSELLQGRHSAGQAAGASSGAGASSSTEGSRKRKR